MPTARADSRAERVAILDGDVRALIAAARTASIPTRGRISSNPTLVAQRGRKAVARHRRWNSHGPPRSGDPYSRTKCLALHVESCSPRLHRLVRVKRIGSLRASAGVLAAGPVTGSLLLPQRPLSAPGDASAEESPGLEAGVAAGMLRVAGDCPVRIENAARSTFA